MSTNSINQLVSQIYQYSQMYPQLSNSQPLRAPSNNYDSPSALEQLGQASQAYVLKEAGKNLADDVLGIAAKQTATTATTTTATTTASTATTSAASTTAAASTSTASTAASSTASTFGAAASIGGAIYGGYQLVKNWGTRDPMSGAASGAAVGAYFGPWGAAIGAVVGAAIGFIKAGKHEDQKKRDSVRAALQENGIIDDKFTIGLADGSRYDIGIDGKPKAEFGNMRPYELDFNQPGVKDAINLINPFMAVLSGGDQKVQSDFTGYFVRAALSNSNGDLQVMKQNAMAIFQQIKMSPEDLVSGLGNLANQGKIDQQTLEVYLAGVRDLLNPEPYVSRIPTDASAQEATNPKLAA